MQGIVHQDIRTENFLVHDDGRTLKLLLSDFGGSLCKALELDGKSLPDDPFSDPDMAEDDETPRRDVFSLSIIIYIIETGRYPFCDGLAPKGLER